MRGNFRWMGLAAVMAAMAGFAACSDPVEKEDPPCAGVDCGSNPYVKCDPVDLECKCGAPEMELICGKDEVCTPQGENQFSCLRTTCDLVPCDRGHTCSQLTGECVCGSGPDAKACEASQTCESGKCVPDACEGVDCRLGTTCDVADGQCKCGGTVCDAGVACKEGVCDETIDYCDQPETDPRRPDCQPGELCEQNACHCGDENAPACASDERCEQGVCEPDDCEGINCPIGTACNPDDGTCHCGDPSGPVCATGEACVDGECKGNPICRDVTCPEGQVCDPDPDTGGFCRCGGIGAGFPRCGDDQTCVLQTGEAPKCVGGQLCRDKDCKEFPGSSCDPEDGVCKCGGLDGVPCRLGEACALDENDKDICAQQCHPLEKECSGEFSCYYDTFSKAALCLGTGNTLPGKSCRRSNDCVPGSYCGKRENETICIELCNAAAAAGEPTGCPEGKICTTLQSAPAEFEGLGFCYTPF